MFEDVTYESILRRMLKWDREYNGNLDTREGSLVWLANAPAAVELQNLYLHLDTVLNETFADTASRKYLEKRAKEQGLSPYPATAAVLRLAVVPASLQLEMGSRFSIGSLNYSVSAQEEGGTYQIVCETPGEAGNEYAGLSVIPVEYVKGLESCTVTALLIPGEDEEDTESFRQRYFDSLNAQSFGGNRADYLEKVNAIPGVGGAKIYGAWNGDIRPAELVPPDEAADWIASASASEEIKTWLAKVYEAGRNNKLTVGGTVKLVLIDSTFSPPSPELVDRVQTAIDPLQNAGEGVGLAPIGHVVKVEGVQSESIDLSFSLGYQTGWTWEDVQARVEETVAKYCKELAEAWAGTEQPLVVRVSQVESRLLEVAGILDIADTKINGEAANYTVKTDHIPVPGKIAPGGEIQNG